jgi:hypothetical protein
LIASSFRATEQCQLDGMARVDEWLEEQRAIRDGGMV